VRFRCTVHVNSNDDSLAHDCEFEKDVEWNDCLSKREMRAKTEEAMNSMMGEISNLGEPCRECSKFVPIQKRHKVSITAATAWFLCLAWKVDARATPTPAATTPATTTTATEFQLDPELLEQNRNRHAAAVAECERMFPIQEYPSAPSNMKWKKYSFPEQQVQDEWPRPPFSQHDLARISQEPVLTRDECALLIQEAESVSNSSGGDKSKWMEGGSRHGTPDDRVGALMPLERLPLSYDLLVNQQVLARVFSSICSNNNFDCLPDPSTLRLGGARIVRYDAAAGQVELGFHRDFLLLTANIALNSPTEFTNGGTLVEAMSPTTPVLLEQGHCLLHPGDVRHAANPITSGKRYVLVLFLLDASDKGIPHDRYLGEYGGRAMMEASQEEDFDAKDYYLSKAAQFYADALKCGGRMDRGIFPWYYHQAGASTMTTTQQSSPEN